MKATVKSNKWYGRFWPPERRKIKIMQVLLDHYQQDTAFSKKMKAAMMHEMTCGDLYHGHGVTYSYWESPKDKDS